MATARDGSEPAPDPGPSPEGRRRRARYGGKHPRRFADKYKEHAPERYPELVARVRERGATPAGQHVPVLAEEVLAALAPRPGERGVDATRGFGGHAERLLERLAPHGRRLALDCDPAECARTRERLLGRGFREPELVVRRTNFAGLGAALAELGWSDGVDFLLADLGVSSMQLDDPRRGFGLREDGPLDMRMNPRRGPSAAQWLEAVPLERLIRVLADNADEPRAERIARALDARRGRLATTGELARAVREALADVHDEERLDASVRRVFQAVRIEVNDELGALESLLRQLPGALRRGARVALISFHSGEDRRIKLALRQGLAAGVFASVTPEPLRASSAERRSNPRSAPAKLRCAVRA
jgi:16S rRNA (cytosine1402-N4)-methyltransferase